MKNEWVTIISIGAEGGKIKLLGKEEEPGQWVFRKVVNEMNYDEPEDRPDEVPTEQKEIRTLNSTISNQTDTVDSWEKALLLFERYPWPMLKPLEIHPAFRKRVWVALQDKCNSNKRYTSYRKREWHKLCFSGEREMR